MIFLSWRKNNLHVLTPTYKELKKRGINVVCAQRKWTPLMDSLKDHGTLLEQCFQCRLYIYCHDTDQPPSPPRSRRLPAYPMFISQRTDEAWPAVHILLTGQTLGTYSHAHWIKKPTTVIQGYRCHGCNYRFSRRDTLAKHTCQKNKKKLYYPGGPHKRTLFLWEQLADEGIICPKPPPKAKHFICWKVQADTVESGRLISIAATTNVPDSFLDKRIVRSPFWTSRRNPKSIFSRFYSWATTLQHRQAQWWEKQTRHIRLQISDHPSLKEELLLKLRSYGEKLPCIAFHAGSFDLKVTSQYWIEATTEGKTPLFQPHVIINRGSYKSVLTKDGIQFLDLAQYVSSDLLTLDDLFKAHQGQGTGHIFPTKAFALWDEFCNLQPTLSGEFCRLCLDPLNLAPSLDIKDFHEWVRAHKYLKLERILEDQSRSDVERMLPIIAKMDSDFSEIDPMLEIFRGNISLPNISRILGYKSASLHGGTFYLPRGDKEGELVEERLRSNLVGGPSIIYKQIVDNSRVLTYDANSLYAWAMCQEMPVGRCLFEFTPNGKMKQYGGQQASISERAWIQMMQKQCNETIATCDNTPTCRMRVIGKSGSKYIADGVILGSKKVFEFLGDYWHARNEKVKGKTEKKLKDLEDAGYQVNYIWEKDFMKLPGARDELKKVQKEVYPSMALEYTMGKRNAIRIMMSEPKVFTKRLMAPFKRDPTC